jgi:hypothetical protein
MSARTGKVCLLVTCITNYCLEGCIGGRYYIMTLLGLFAQVRIIPDVCSDACQP